MFFFDSLSFKVCKLLKFYKNMLKGELYFRIRRAQDNDVETTYQHVVHSLNMKDMFPKLSFITQREKRQNFPDPYFLVFVLKTDI